MSCVRASAPLQKRERGKCHFNACCRGGLRKRRVAPCMRPGARCDSGDGVAGSLEFGTSLLNAAPQQPAHPAASPPDVDGLSVVVLECAPETARLKPGLHAAGQVRKHDLQHGSWQKRECFYAGQVRKHDLGETKRRWQQECVLSCGKRKCVLPVAQRERQGSHSAGQASG